jgi:hypothetical protein
LLIFRLFNFFMASIPKGACAIIGLN